MTASIAVLSAPLIAEYVLAPINLWTGRTMPNFVRFIGLPPRAATRLSPRQLVTAGCRILDLRRARPALIVLQAVSGTCLPKTSHPTKELPMDMKLELVPLPVSDVDLAKAFYADQVGFHVDHDHRLGDDVRFVQLTPPGSACSIVIGTGITDAAPGSMQGTLLVVSDIDAARAELSAAGIEISQVQDMEWGARHAYFSDPDGNTWQLQQPNARA